MNIEGHIHDNFSNFIFSHFSIHHTPKLPADYNVIAHSPNPRPGIFPPRRKNARENDGRLCKPTA